MTHSRRWARVMVTGHILYLLGPKSEQNFIFMMKWPLEVGIAEFRTQASFPFKQRSQQPCTTRPEKKKKSWATTKQTNTQLGFRKFREDQKSLSLLKLFKHIYAYFSLSSYLCCWFLYIDLRRAFQLQVTHKVSSEKNEAWKIPSPAWGEGRHSGLNLFPNHCSVLEVGISQRPETEIPLREGEKAFSWCEQACEENASFCGLKPGGERVYLQSPSEGFHSEELAIFC